MSTDIQEAPVEYKLRVQNTLIPCSKRVISSSAVLLDMMDLVRPDDDRWGKGLSFGSNLLSFGDLVKIFGTFHM